MHQRLRAEGWSAHIYNVPSHAVALVLMLHLATPSDWRQARGISDTIASCTQLSN